MLLAASERLGDDQIAALVQRIPTGNEQPQLWSDDLDMSLMRDVIVFSRHAATLSTDAELATTLKRRGASVQLQVSDKTTIYVLSNAEWRDQARTGQRKRAAERVGRGQRLQIMSETDFLAMIEHS